MARQLPLPKFHFRVDWGDAGGNIRFSEVSGLEMETEVIEHRDGSSPEFFKEQIPGMKKFAKVVLKRGLFQGDNEFYNWINTTGLLNVERRDVTIALLDEKHETVVKWALKNAWPSKLTATDLKADANEIAIETLELTHSGLTIEHVS